MLSKLMSRYWWVLLLRGAFAILFGIVALAYPGITLGSLVLYFAAFAFVDGILNVFHAFFGREENESWWVLLFEGLLGIAFGVITFQAPGITTLMLLLYIGFWAMATGVLRIILAVSLRHEITGEWWMALGGLVSILFGVSMVSRPGRGCARGAHRHRDLVDCDRLLARLPRLQGEVGRREAGSGQTEARHDLASLDHARSDGACPEGSATTPVALPGITSRL